MCVGSKIRSRGVSVLFLVFVVRPPAVFFFFFNDTATTEIYTLSLHDALPIYAAHRAVFGRGVEFGDPDNKAGDRQADDRAQQEAEPGNRGAVGDRKSTRVNSSHT